DCAEYILQSPSVDINDVNSDGNLFHLFFKLPNIGKTLLHIILESKVDDSMKLAKHLIMNKNASVNTFDFTGMTILHLLAQHSHKQDAELLNLVVEKIYKKYINHLNSNSYSPLLTAICHQNIP